MEYNHTHEHTIYEPFVSLDDIPTKWLGSLGFVKGHFVLCTMGFITIKSGQIIASSHDLTPKGS